MGKTGMSVSFKPAALRTRRSVTAAALLTFLAAGPAAGAPQARSSPQETWVSVSYRELLDPETLTRSGAKLVDALHRTSARAEVQPFLDPYSSLLGYAVQMIAGADVVPQTPVAERYLAGAAQPAWAAVLRGGRFFVSADGQGRARVFVPGDDPRTAYRRAYPLLRHPLASALAPGVPLQVEVYAYHNDFAGAELRLNPVPYRFQARSFPPPGRPLNLPELEAFFRQGGQLEGTELAPEAGLVLYASQSPQPTLGGEPVTLADLAVAYRAVRYAGENEAFVSLDRNADPTQATVSFGGLLEDTRVGKAVLAADVRFKTICSGLDPVTHADIREQTRGAVPSFMSNAERRFVADPTGDLAQWVTARYWYYPDSCGVETDPEDRMAAVTKAQLTADVERVGAGAKPAGGGRAALPPGYAESIRDLNANYARYATLFPEYRDLTAATRLMALASWLGRVRPEWLDLDGLLAVTLPPESTPRALPQLVSASVLQLPGAASPGREYVQRNTQIRNLTPELSRTVADYFGEPQNLAVFLAFKSGRQSARAREFAAAAAQLFAAAHDRPVRDLLRTTEDMHAFLRAYAARVIGELSGDSSGTSGSDRKRLKAVLAELDALPPASGAGGESDERRRVLEDELAVFMRKYHAQGPDAARTTVVATQYTGGVSLSPRLFTVKKSAARPALEKLKVASRGAGTAWGAAGWIRSSASPTAATGVSRAPAPPTTAGKPTAPATTATPAAPSAPATPSRPDRAAPAPAAPNRPAGAPQPPAVKPRPIVPDDAAEEVLPARPAPVATLTSIAVPKSATPAGAALVGRIGEGGRIVFTRAPR